MFLAVETKMVLALKEDRRLKARRAWGIGLLVLAIPMPIAVYLWGAPCAHILTDFFEAIDEQAEERVNAISHHYPPTPRDVRLAMISIATPLAIGVLLFLWGLHLLDPST